MRKEQMILYEAILFILVTLLMVEIRQRVRFELRVSSKQVASRIRMSSKDDFGLLTRIKSERFRDGREIVSGQLMDVFATIALLFLQLVIERHVHMRRHRFG